jgi:hypothetical protein
MTGHRRSYRRPTRTDARNYRMYEQVAAPGLRSDQQLAVAWDWWRSAIAQIEDPRERARLRNAMANELVSRVFEITGWTPPESEIFQQRAAEAEAAEARAAAGGYPA